MDIRPCRAGDIDALVAIFNDAIVNTTAIWLDRPVSRDNRAAWVDARQAAGFPVLVAEVDGTVAGYASFGEFRAFEGYRHTVEHSVYVAAGFRRRGIARRLLTALEGEASARGLHVMIGGITADNDVSLRLHGELGFTETARMPEVGRKFDRWLTLVFMQKVLIHDR